MAAIPLPRTQRVGDGYVNLPLWREAFAGLDWLSLRFSDIYAARNIERGHGQPVVVVPGLLCDDTSLIELHGWLERAGYRPYYSHIGYIARCPDELVARLVRTIERAHAETGQPVRLIGHSLGGLLARGAALARPELVEQVITLGSPVQGFRAHISAAFAAELVRGNCDGACMEKMQRPLPRSINEVNVYTPTDGVVDPATCVRAHGSRAVRVEGTHTGLAVNANVYRALAAELASCARPAVTVRRQSRVARAAVDEARTLAA